MTAPINVPSKATPRTPVPTLIQPAIEGFEVTKDRVTKDRDPALRHIKTEVFREAAESIEADRAEVDAEMADLPNIKRAAKVEGYAVGVERGEADAAAKVASADVQADQTTKRAQATAERLRTEAERDAESNPGQLPDRSGGGGHRGSPQDGGRGTGDARSGRQAHP